MTLKLEVVGVDCFSTKKSVPVFFFLPGGGEMRGPGLDAITENLQRRIDQD